MSNVRTSLAAIRKKIADRQAERQRLNEQRRSRSEVVAFVTSLFEQADEHARAVRARDLECLAFKSDRPALFDLLGVFGGGREPSPDLGPLIVSMIGADKVRAAWLEAIDSVPVGLDGLSQRQPPRDDGTPAPREPSPREKRLAEIARELDALELQEEALIVQSEAEGDPIDRREDARPEIVLALPGAFDA